MKILMLILGAVIGAANIFIGVAIGFELLSLHSEFFAAPEELGLWKLPLAIAMLANFSMGLCSTYEFLDMLDEYIDEYHDNQS